MPSDFVVIILTHNEERNLPGCLDSLKDLANQIFIVDSGSTDRTLEIIKERGIDHVHHPFENYSKQRNWAQAHCPFESEWVLHLDADERLSPEMVTWLNDSFDPNASYDGYLFSRRTVFFGKFIRYGGHYPNYHLRLYRKSKGRCEDKLYDQHFICDGPLCTVRKGTDIIDTVTNSLEEFSRSHVRWAMFEAISQLSQNGQNAESVEAKATGGARERRRWLKSSVYGKFPLFVRTFSYFLVRYFLRGGFLDGRQGLVFHVIQGFWFRFLIDAMVLELRNKMKKGKTLREVLEADYPPQYLKLLD